MRNKSKQIRIVGGLAFVPLSQGREAIINAEDVAAVAQLNWHAVKAPHGAFYAVSNLPRVNGKRFQIRMHRLLLAEPENCEVDHINGDGLDNRRSNLRLATSSQQKMNTAIRSNNKSGFKGVSWNTARQRWRATISANGKYHDLGTFKTPEQAHDAYLLAAATLHGEFARSDAALARMRGARS